MAMNSATLASTIKSALLAEFLRLGWVAANAPAGGTNAGDTNVAPSTVQDRLAEAIANAVATSVVTHIQGFAVATGLDSHLDAHSLSII